MTPKTHAYFLVAHGSRRSQSQESLHQLADYFRAALMATQRGPVSPSSLWVTTGCLEFHERPLSEQLVQFYRSLPSVVEHVHVLPMFLLPGNHVCEDIPAAIDQAQESIQRLNIGRESPSTPFLLCSHLGSHPNLQKLIQVKMQSHQPEAWILLGHGSRRPEGNLAIKQSAQQLEAIPAFWAVQPSLTAQVMTLRERGIRSIGVIPYFLFSGKITDAIALQCEQLSSQYPEITLQVLSPLSSSPALAHVLLELSQSPPLMGMFQAKAI